MNVRAFRAAEANLPRPIAQQLRGSGELQAYQHASVGLDCPCGIYHCTIVHHPTRNGNRTMKVKEDEAGRIPKRCARSPGTNVALPVNTHAGLYANKIAQEAPQRVEDQMPRLCEPTAGGVSTVRSRRTRGRERATMSWSNPDGPFILMPRPTHSKKR